jgi:hypothetical protein
MHNVKSILSLSNSDNEPMIVAGTSLQLGGRVLDPKSGAGRTAVHHADGRSEARHDKRNGDEQHE